MHHCLQHSNSGLLCFFFASITRRHLNPQVGIAQCLTQLQQGSTTTCYANNLTKLMPTRHENIHITVIRGIQSSAVAAWRNLRENVVQVDSKKRIRKYEIMTVEESLLIQSTYLSSPQLTLFFLLQSTFFSYFPSRLLIMFERRTWRG